MIFLDIWRSYRSLPLWVQIWVAGILVPVNSAVIFFIFQPSGMWIALFAIGAMLPNIPIMLYERGLSKMMVFPHLILWNILVLWLAIAMPEGSAAYTSYLWILLVTNAISPGFDIPDALKWRKGDRAVAAK